MTEREYDSTRGLYPHNNVTSQQVAEVKQDLQQLKRLLAKVADRLAVRVD